MTTGKWSESGVPHRGWCCIDIYDEGEPCHTCEMCETTLVRYVHVMEHPEYPDTLSVGCICAGNMEQDYLAAQAREKRFKQRSARRSHWLTREWRTSYSGNDFINADGFNVVVFRRGEFWCGRVKHSASGDQSYTQSYQTAEQAKLAAFDAMLQLKQTGGGS